MSRPPQLSLRSVEYSLQRFRDALPPLYGKLSAHVAAIRDIRERGDIRALNREQIAASKTFKSLNSCLRELDEVQNRLGYDDQSKFRSQVKTLREEAFDQIVAFVELDNSLDGIDSSSVLSGYEVPGPSVQGMELEQGPHPELTSLQAKQKQEEDLVQLEAAAKSWGQLQQDIQDVAEIMAKLSHMVHGQQEELNTIEAHVEQAKENTSLGLLEIIKARRARFATVPVVGAVVGGLVGGPIGILAGFKIAGLFTAAIGSYAGYKGGKFLRNRVNTEPDAVPGMLEAPTLGAYQDDVLSDDSGEYVQLDDK